MLLLEEVVNVTDETATCRVTVSPHSVLAPFLDAEGNLPGWFALELMAQNRRRLVPAGTACKKGKRPSH